MIGRCIRWALAGAVALLVSAAPPARAEVAGDVAAMRMWAYGTPPQEQRRDLFLHDEVFVRELLETVPQGILHVRLRDNTMLRLGSDSRVVLDEFVYAPESDSASLLVSVTKGVCRFVSGNAAMRRLEVRTPSATIAARGTEFSVWIEEGGSVRVWVQSGSVEVTPLDGGAPATVNATEIVLVPGGGGAIQLNARRPAADPGMADTTRVLLRRKNK